MTCYNYAGMSVFKKDTTYHGIQLDSLLLEDTIEWRRVKELVSEGIKSGVVKPVSCTVFKKDKVEEAFRLMASGRYNGKILIEVLYKSIFLWCRVYL